MIDKDEELPGDLSNNQKHINTGEVEFQKEKEVANQNYIASTVSRFHICREPTAL